MISKRVLKIIKPVMDMLTPSCEIITQKVSKSMDEPLTWKERIQVRLHLMVCELCIRYRQQLLSVRDMIRQRTDNWMDDTRQSALQLSPEARQRIKKKLTYDSAES